MFNLSAEQINYRIIIIIFFFIELCISITYSRLFHLLQIKVIKIDL